MKIIKLEGEIDFSLPVFAKEKFLKCRSDHYGWFMDENFILPYIIDKKLIFKRLIFTTECISKTSENPIDAEKNFLNAVVRECKKENLCDFIYKAQANAVFNTCPDDADCVGWGTYVVDIEEDIEESIKKMSSNGRRDVRKAMRSGVTVEQTDDIVLAHDIIEQMFARQGSSFAPSIDYLRKLHSNLPENIILTIVKKDDIVQGVTVVLYDSIKAYTLYIGSIAKPFTGSLILLNTMTMNLLYNKNIKVYDFVGARTGTNIAPKYQRIQRFKKGFGSQLIEGHAFRVLIKPLKYKIFIFMVKIYYRLKRQQFIDVIDELK